VLGVRRPGRITRIAVVTDWSVDPRNTAPFFCKVFDECIGRIWARCWSVILRRWWRNTWGCRRKTASSTILRQGVAVNTTAAFIPANHYVYPEYRLGHLRERPLAEMCSRPPSQFGYGQSRDSAPVLPRVRVSARLRGECPRNRLIRAPDGETGLELPCARDSSAFYQHVLPTVDRIAAECGENRRLTLPCTIHAFLSCAQAVQFPVLTAGPPSSSRRFQEE